MFAYMSHSQSYISENEGKANMDASDVTLLSSKFIISHWFVYIYVVKIMHIYYVNSRSLCQIRDITRFQFTKSETYVE